MPVDRCDKCNKISMVTHIIFDTNTGQTDETWVSRKAGVGELIFCTYSCCREYKVRKTW